MKFFSRGKKNEAEEQEVSPDDELLDKIDELQKTTQEIEEEKYQKKLAREERKFHKEQALKRKKRERWVAPVLLLLTILVSYLVWIFSR